MTRAASGLRLRRASGLTLVLLGLGGLAWLAMRPPAEERFSEPDHRNDWLAEGIRREFRDSHGSTLAILAGSARPQAKSLADTPIRVSMPGTIELVQTTLHAVTASGSWTASAPLALAEAGGLTLFAAVVRVGDQERRCAKLQINPKATIEALPPGW